MKCFMEPLGERELPDSTNYSVSGTKNQQVVPKKELPKKKAPGSPALHLVLGTSYSLLRLLLFQHLDGAPQLLILLRRLRRGRLGGRGLVFIRQRGIIFLVGHKDVRGDGRILDGLATRRVV